MKYGSSATKRKVYVGRCTNFFQKIGVAEFLLESQHIEQGDEYLVLGETTGVVEGVAEDMRVELKRVERVDKGTYFSIKTPTPIRRNDKLYKMIRVEEQKF